jgi:hypothetical protein
MHPHIAPYLQSLAALYSQGIATEHSFRGALESLLKNITGFTVVNEARHIACGAPDLTLLKNNIPIGYVEAKDIGKSLNSKDYKNQFDRYKKALDNLIITDYLTFQLFEGENFITEVSIGKITSTNPSKGGESPLSNWRGAGGEVPQSTNPRPRHRYRYFPRRSRAKYLSKI